jgi:hypothetical protein
MRKTLFVLGLIAACTCIAGAAVTSLADDAKKDKAATAADDTKEFFNGKDLTGWEGLEKYWSVKDSAIIGSTNGGKISHNTFLCSKKRYKDFELSFKVRLKDGEGNSGVQIRSEIADKDKFTCKGPQADIAKGYWGSLYGELFGGMMKEADKKVVEKVLKEADFNDYYVKVVGKHCTIKLNGTTTVDQDFDKMPDDGIIAWQLHAGYVMEVTFKDIEFKDLSKK